jgi:glutathione S-transferase
MNSPAHYQLYYSLRSPFARRVRIALHRLNIPFEPLEINVFDPTRTFLETNPLGTVPAMSVQIGEDKISLGDSSAILEFLHENYGGKIWPSELKVRAQVRAASTLAVGLMTQTVALYLERTRKLPALECELDFETTIEMTLHQIAQQAIFEMPWKVSDFQLTQAGYDLMTAVDYIKVRLAHVDFSAKWPELERFYQTHKNRNDLAPTAPPPSAS